MIIELSLVLICHFQKRLELTHSYRRRGSPSEHRGCLREVGALLPAQTTLPSVVILGRSGLGATSPHCTALQAGSSITPLHWSKNPAPGFPPRPPPSSKPPPPPSQAQVPLHPPWGQTGSFHMKPHLSPPSSEPAMALPERGWVPPAPPLQPPTAPCPHSELQHRPPPHPSCVSETFQLDCPPCLSPALRLSPPREARPVLELREWAWGADSALCVWG